MAHYLPENCRELEKEFFQLELHRPFRSSRYDPGRKLFYSITSIDNKYKLNAELKIEKFVGGGFAGQVYQVKIISLEGQIEGFTKLQVGKFYALKILIPPSAFSRFFRNLLYWIGFQAPFQLQINPAAHRAGAIWQKLIRQAAAQHFGDENCVVDVYGLFIDQHLGSCGEISEWIEGRTWWLEVNDRINYLSKIKKSNLQPEEQRSPEFVAKYKFMKDFVALLHKMGAPEVARQYEWSTMKSQPNCLKRSSSYADPSQGLVAVDFRAGLALLPFLPMSPGDFKLIIKGIARGSLVQFDRGNISRLKNYLATHFEPSEELDKLVQELTRNEEVYRNSVPDITRNHFRLLFSRKLWSNIFRSSRKGWRITNLLDQKCENKLGSNRFLMIIFYIFSLIPILGKFLIKTLGAKNWRDHYIAALTKFSYFRKALQGIQLEKLIKWYRAGRITAPAIEKIKKNALLYFFHLSLSIFPSGLQRFLTDKTYFKAKLYGIFVRPIKLYFNADLRQVWLKDMVAEGKKKHMLSEADANTIIEQLDEPFIQKYLKSLAVHVCTIPITQVVSVLIALIYVLSHPEMPRTQAWGIGVGIIALFQVIPVSPGSLVRGLYVIFLVLKEKNLRDYNIAVFLSFFKYVGYLAFPIQMTYRYPALARFMAGHWATEVVHVIPVFGEKGALLEHWVFDLFYNWPLTIRRQMKERREQRKLIPSRFWHIPLILAFTAMIFLLLDLIHIYRQEELQNIRTIWWAACIFPFISGSLLDLGYGGLTFSKRIGISVFTGILLAIISTLMSSYLGFQENIYIEMSWRIFIMGLFTTLGSLSTEILLGENV